MRLTGHVARSGEKINAKYFVWKNLKERRRLEIAGLDGSITLRGHAVVQLLEAL
jgi:hypothetical protein